MDMFFDILDATAKTLNVIAIICVIIGGYLAPSLIASHRDHHNFSAIFALNLLLGWTFLFWVVAFVWAMTQPRTQ